MGFNCEIIQDRIDYACWDIGGCNIYGGEQNCEYFARGSDYGVNLFLKNIPCNGIIFVVNVSQDVEYLVQAKMVLHDLIMGNGQIRDVQLIIIFNKKPDILKKAGTQDESKNASEIFMREDIRKINNAWTECPFNNE